eukprot:scaffold49087_cov60-Phaeocystis_antarctica.AAC.1
MLKSVRPKVTHHFASRPLRLWRIAHRAPRRRRSHRPSACTWGAGGGAGRSRAARAIVCRPAQASARSARLPLLLSGAQCRGTSATRERNSGRTAEAALTAAAAMATAESAAATATAMAAGVVRYRRAAPLASATQRMATTCFTWRPLDLLLCHRPSRRWRSRHEASEP